MKSSLIWLRRVLSKQHLFVLKLVISLGLVAYCISLIDFKTLSFAQIDFRWIFASLLILLANNLIGALRFKTLLDPIFPLDLRNHVKYYFWAGFFNAVLPTSLGGDAMRIIWLTSKSVASTSAAFAVILERLFGVMMLVGIAATAAQLLPPNADVDKFLTLIINLCIVGLVSAIAVLMALRYQQSLGGILTISIPVNKEALSKLPYFQISALTLVYQLLTIGSTLCIAQSLMFSVDVLVWFVVMPLIWILTLIPLSMGGLGVRELGYIFFLGAYGQPVSQCLLLGLLSFVVQFTAGVIGGIWYTLGNEEIKPIPR